MTLLILSKIWSAYLSKDMLSSTDSFPVSSTLIRDAKIFSNCENIKGIAFNTNLWLAEQSKKRCQTSFMFSAFSQIKQIFVNNFYSIN